MEEYIELNDSIIGKKVLYNDTEIGTVKAKISEGTARRGAEYSVLLADGNEVYITDRSLGRFKIIKTGSR